MAASERLQVGLFASSDRGVRLIGRTTAPDLVEAVRSRLASEQRRQLAELEPSVRAVSSDSGGSEG
jgi:hypothetical protein